VTLLDLVFGIVFSILVGLVMLQSCEINLIPQGMTDHEWMLYLAAYFYLIVAFIRIAMWMFA
jgi:hypothetical protein